MAFNFCKIQEDQKHLICIIAEMACSHEGDPALARKIIDGAANAGANAIQFQIWLAEDIMAPHHPDYPVVARLELTRPDWTSLATHVHEHYPNMQIIACVQEIKSVDFCETIGVSAYKLHSSDLSNPQVIRRVAATGKRIDLSVGASTIDEISMAIDWIRTTSNSEIWLMYGYQGFPTPTDAINLDYMMKLRQLFDLPFGYQDHCDAEDESAFWLPAAAVGMGVNIIEKHITHDRSFKGVDHQAALNPDEFDRFVNMIREIELAKGVSTPKPFSEEELTYRKYSKKSIATAHDIAAGTQLNENDLVFLRMPDLGLPPDQMHRLTGRKTKRDIGAYQLVIEDDVI